MAWRQHKTVRKTYAADESQAIWTALPATEPTSGSARFTIRNIGTDSAFFVVPDDLGIVGDEEPENAMEIPAGQTRTSPSYEWPVPATDKPSLYGLIGAICLVTPETKDNP